MLKPKNWIIPGTALAVVVVTWPSAAVLPCDLNDHAAAMMCMTEAPDLAHGPDRDQPGPQRSERTLKVTVASTASNFGGSVALTAIGTGSLK